jgi:hypothetical protein
MLDRVRAIAGEAHDVRREPVRLVELSARQSSPPPRATGPACEERQAGQAIPAGDVRGQRGKLTASPTPPGRGGSRHPRLSRPRVRGDDPAVARLRARHLRGHDGIRRYFDSFGDGSEGAYLEARKVTGAGDQELVDTALHARAGPPLSANGSCLLLAHRGACCGRRAVAPSARPAPASCIGTAWALRAQPRRIPTHGLRFRNRLAALLSDGRG